MKVGRERSPVRRPASKASLADGRALDTFLRVPAKRGAIPHYLTVCEAREEKLGRTLAKKGQQLLRVDALWHEGLVAYSAENESSSGTRVI